MARVAVALSCTTEVMSELEGLSRSRSGEVRLVERARIVLACLQGRRNDELAREMNVRPNTVGRWRSRFAGLPPAAWPDCAMPPGQANLPGTVSNCVLESWRNWRCRRRRAWPVGTVVRWRWR